ncbi:hypothetical protein CMI37_32755 [Candidatus Pacearchaeota archaeon]|nr:hypothetical protein [Candidatus Pacearchaeota archaeon]|tara:strand:+ start:920 stop:2716 length:1797 start_codon:yes stop_codon:yes gene_type:complete
MPNEQKKILPINYTSREFESIRNDLMEIAERFYPDSFQDFSEASFGSLMLDAVAYVGDQLSFYLDYNVNESFLDTAYQFNNILRHGRILGYKYDGRPSTYGQVALYVMIPASQTALGPDAEYIPILKKGSRFTSETGLNFVLTDNIDFADPINPVVVALTDTSTGAPTYYAIKAYGNVVSGFFSQETVPVGNYERFKRVKLTSANVSEIIAVYDSDGHEYFEVDYLSQDMVYKELSNENYKDDNVPSILKPYLVSRKFIVERDRFNTYIQFGSGETGQSDVVADPQAVAMDVFGKTYVTDITFDPTRLTKNKSLGIVPSNTTLTVAYRVTNPTNSNVASGQLTKVSSMSLEFANIDKLNTDKIKAVEESLEVANETPIVGDVTNATSGEIKQRIFDTFPTQNRAVTQADYENLTYRMPPKFGSLKRCSAQQDPSSQKRNLNLYVISQDSFGKLVTTNNTIKNNLKTWLNQHRMINDTIDILDPYILNLGIEFVIKTTTMADKYTTLDAAITKLKNKFEVGFFIGEQLYISDIYKELKDVPGILDVVKVKLTNKTGVNYSGATIDINRNLSPDGDYLVTPKNAIIEIKYPETDIKGKMR